MRGVFVTGTDTGVGKTVVAGALIRALGQRDIPVAARKPVESGCIADDGELFPADGTALAAAAGNRESLEQVTPLRLRHPLSPERAATLEGVDLRLVHLHEAVLAGDPTDFRVVEGAGGFLSPLCSDGLNADLARALGLPVMLVVADRLGSINHALLSLEAIAARGLVTMAVVMNAVGPERQELMDNRADLAHRLDVPVIPFGWKDDPVSADRLAELLVTCDEY